MINEVFENDLGQLHQEGNFLNSSFTCNEYITPVHEYLI